jgi:Ca-activated chloride channel family protein
MSDDLSNFNLVELIELLEPVREPDVVSLVPQTAGWIWLGLLVVALASFAVHRLVVRRRANAYRRVALRKLAVAGSDPAAIAQILRRAALSVYPRNEVASLYGREWLAFLDSTYEGGGFRSGPGQALATAPYTKASHADGLSELAATWIRRHRADLK